MIQIGALPATIDTPVEHLTACHRRIEQRLETLIKAGEQIGANRALALDAIRKSLLFLDTSGALHTQDEEASLLPRLRPKVSASEIAFLDSLEAQHKQADAIYCELKQLAAVLPEDASAQLTGRYVACAKALEALYREHIRAEDETLTEMARRHLTEAEILEISREMRARRA